MTQAALNQGHPAAGPIRAGRISSLDGKTAVVTGAARAIGRAIAVELAANGADVVAVDICGPVSPASDAKPATPARARRDGRGRSRSSGAGASAVRADIRDIGALRGVADQTVKQFGKVDIVVANAAIQRWVPLLEMQDSDWRDVIDNNLNGTANTIRAFAPHMVERKYGRIIVLSSMQGKHGTKDASSYSASKWGILGLMKSAAMELGQYGITVNAILPGLVDTPLTEYPKRYSHAIGEHRPNPPQNPSAAGGVGRAGADGAAEGGLAAAGGHLAGGGVPGVGRGGDGDGGGLRSDRRGQRAERVSQRSVPGHRERRSPVPIQAATSTLRPCLRALDCCVAALLAMSTVRAHRTQR